MKKIDEIVEINFFTEQYGACDSCLVQIKEIYFFCGKARSGSIEYGIALCLNCASPVAHALNLQLPKSE